MELNISCKKSPRNEAFFLSEEIWLQSHMIYYKKKKKRVGVIIKTQCIALTEKYILQHCRDHQRVKTQNRLIPIKLEGIINIA